MSRSTRSRPCRIERMGDMANDKLTERMRHIWNSPEQKRKTEIQTHRRGGAQDLSGLEIVVFGRVLIDGPRSCATGQVKSVANRDSGPEAARPPPLPHCSVQEEFPSARPVPAGRTRPRRALSILNAFHLPSKSFDVELRNGLPPHRTI